ncbi:AraC family transcriptional regulator [uncultured Clostridium sp.]|uniref:helix-turn-helix domain-containing protein n=1 Tax=uncultured Clostridium sp. TaxID=59620 RepID=UPI0025E609F4|nr:AraC family transcriptional regulator [uncultured Clostridium sp.]
MSYQFTELKEELRIGKIVSLHYFEYMSDFTFPGESHNFWEFMYVDKGELQVTADREKFVLHQGQIIFHRPNEFHALAANNVIAPNLVVISFEAGEPCMAFFEHKILTVGESERNLLSQIIAEARDTFDGPMDDPYMEVLSRRENIPFGAEQMIKIHLEQFLIQLFRTFSGAFSYNEEKPLPALYNPGRTPALSDGNELFASIIDYLDRHIGRQLTVEKICRDNLIGASQLKKLFRTYQKSGVMECFNQMKISAAKQMIRNQQMNFTQIADALGYTSVHYFSRQFKKITDMTPTEYRASIMQRAKRPQRKHL